ncbi:MAG: hypothetical protein K1W33_06910 [Clostridia bacterium]
MYTNGKNLGEIIATLKQLSIPTPKERTVLVQIYYTRNTNKYNLYRKNSFCRQKTHKEKNRFRLICLRKKS